MLNTFTMLPGRKKALSNKLTPYITFVAVGEDVGELFKEIFQDATTFFNGEKVLFFRSLDYKILSNNKKRLSIRMA